MGDTKKKRRGGGGGWLVAAKIQLLKERTNKFKLNSTYMSITSLIRTLTATSIDGVPLLLLNLDERVVTLEFGEDDSAQTAVITSCTSVGFKRKGCCSLNQIKKCD